MTDKNSNETPDIEIVDESEVQPNKLQKFVNKHPRAAKVVAIIGGVTAVAGVATVTNTMLKNKQHLELAKDHTKETLHELSEAVSPSSETPA